jgi:hypothetical protein
LPEDISKCLPKLETLDLDNCSQLQSLPWTLGSIKSLSSVSVRRGCYALAYPPASQRSDPIKTAKYLRNVHDNSEMWRRMKVKFAPYFAA